MNRLFIGLSVLLLLLNSSCGNPKKDALLEAYDNLYSSIINEQYLEVYNSLTEESQQYIEDLAKAKSDGFDAIFDLGHEERLSYVTILAAAKMGITDNPKTTFFKYLCLQDISIFSCYNIYHPISDKTTFNPTPFVAVYRESELGKSIRYLRFIEQKEGNFLLDLLYTLQQEENVQKSIYANDLKTESKGNMVAHMDKLYRSTEVKTLNTFGYDDAVKERLNSVN